MNPITADRLHKQLNKLLSLTTSSVTHQIPIYELGNNRTSQHRRGLG